MSDDVAFGPLHIGLPAGEVRQRPDEALADSPTAELMADDALLTAHGLERP